MSEENGKVAIELTLDEIYQAIGGCLMMVDRLTHGNDTGVCYAYREKAKQYKALALKLDAQYCKAHAKSSTEFYLATYDGVKNTWKADVAEKTPPKPKVPLGKKAARAEVGAK